MMSDTYSREDRLQQFEERPKRNIEAVQLSETNVSYVRALIDGRTEQPSDGRPLRVFFSNGAYPHGTFIVMGEWLVVANQDSQTITLLHWDAANERLRFTGRSMEAIKPTCVCPVPV